MAILNIDEKSDCIMEDDQITTYDGWCYRFMLGRRYNFLQCKPSFYFSITDLCLVDRPKTILKVDPSKLVDFENDDEWTVRNAFYSILHEFENCGELYNGGGNIDTKESIKIYKKFFLDFHRQGTSKNEFYFKVIGEANE